MGRWVDGSITEEKRGVYLSIAVVQPLVGVSALVNGSRFDDTFGVVASVVGYVCLAVGLFGAAALVVLRRRRPRP